MSINTTNKAGVNRDYGRALIQKWAFFLSHLIIVLFIAWLTFFNGITRIGEIVGKEWVLSDPIRAIILFSCALLYWVRHGITLFYLIQRKIDWSEVTELVIFMAFFEIGLFLVGGGAFRYYVIELNWLDSIALIFLLTGSFLNSYSEIQRKVWKKDSRNMGHCYTKGLFRYSMHINYFGDIVLFTGWCLFTYNFWTLGLPLLMALMFVFMHIPGLDRHLLERYGDEFKIYSEQTRNFIPYVY